MNNTSFCMIFFVPLYPTKYEIIKKEKGYINEKDIYRCVLRSLIGFVWHKQQDDICSGFGRRMEHHRNQQQGFGRFEER